MAVIVSEGFNVTAPFVIDRRMIVDSVDSTPDSLINLQINYNYTNMIVWVRDEKAFYYLIDIPTQGGSTASDWVKFSGGGATGCAKSGYVSGTSFTGNPATASVVFGTPYESASYSVSITGLTNNPSTGYNDYVYSVINKTSNGFIIQVDTTGPIGATAMWITNCWDGSGLSSGGAAGAQGPTGPGGESAIDLEEIAFGTGTGITSSDIFTFDPSTANFLLGSHKVDNSFRSSIIGATGSIICNSTHSIIINSSLDNVYGAKICESKNAIIINSPRSCITNESGAYCNVSRQFIIGGYLHTMCQKEGPGVGNGYLGGSGILGGAGNCIYTGAIHSLILGGRCNVLKNLNYYNSFFSDTYKQKFTGGRSVIVGGENNLLSGPKIDGSVIIGGCTNSITSGTLFSTIVGGCRNIIATSSNSAIIGGICNWMTASDTGSIMFSKNSSIDDGSLGYSELSSIFLGNNSKITLSCKAVIISSNNSNISGSIHSLASSIILGGFDNSIGVGNNSMILGGQSNYICCVNSAVNTGGNSFIIGGRQNSICGLGAPRPSYSSIIGGSTNSITGRYATIINSCKSLITCINCFNTIISSVGSTISFQPGSPPFSQNVASQNSLIIGGSGNKICGAVNSAIIGGQNIVLYGEPSILASGVSDRFHNVVAVPSLIGHGSLALSVGTTSTNILLNQNHFTMIAYPPDPGTIDVCLPSANAQGRIYIIKKSGSSTQSTVKVCPYSSVGSECIDGYAGYVELINPWDYYMLQADGVDNWIKLGGAVGLNL